MDANQITSSTNTYQTSETYRKDSGAKTTTEKNTATTGTASAKGTADTSAVVYEKNSTEKASTKNSKNKNYVTLSKENQNIISQLKADAEQRTAQLRSLVESMISKQNKTYQTGSLTDSDMYSLLRSGKLSVTPEVRAQAAADIADDGYWGVEQTSERLFSFAKAISGDDTKKVDELLKAMEKGFKLATKSFGGNLPDICQKTLDKATEKLKSWAKESKDASSEQTDAAAKELQNQAAASSLAK